MKQEQPTQEQRKEFWEWCGLQEGWFKLNTGMQVMANFPELDLNNLFKYAVKVLEKCDIKIFSFYDDLNSKVFWFVYIIDRRTGEVEFVNVEGEEELKDALFWAIWEVIKK